MRNASLRTVLLLALTAGTYGVTAHLALGQGYGDAFSNGDGSESERRPSKDAPRGQEKGTSGKAAKPSKPGKKEAPKGKAQKKAPRKPKPRAQGVRGMFEQGMELYGAGKFAEAIVVFDQTLRRYPGHEPSRLYLAKSFYRLDRFKEAYAVFTKINPQFLDPETAYEYGWSFYKNKQWEGALYAFQRIPEGHSLSDLANYYGGISAIKLRRYEEAEDMLEKAVVLPDKLAKTRTLYLKHVQALLVMQQKAALAKERRSIRERMKQKARAESQPEQAPAEGKGYVHKGYLYVEKAALVDYTVLHQFIGYHGTKEGTFDSRVATLEVQSGPLLPLPIEMPKGRQAAFGTQLILTARNEQREGTEQRIVIDESTDDLRRLQLEKQEPIDRTTGRFRIEPWFEFPLPVDAWLGLGGFVDFTYPEFERGLRSGIRGGYLQIASPVDRYTVDSRLTYSETLNADTEPTTTILTGHLGISTRFDTGTLLAASLDHKVFDYLVLGYNKNGPDSSTAVSVDLGQELLFNLVLGAIGAYEYQANYLHYDIPNYEQGVAADGQVYTGKIYFVGSPLPWLSILIEQLYSKTDWQLAIEDRRDVFERNVADSIEQTRVSAALNLAF